MFKQNTSSRAEKSVKVQKAVLGTYRMVDWM